MTAAPTRSSRRLTCVGLGLVAVLALGALAAPAPAQASAPTPERTQLTARTAALYLTDLAPGRPVGRFTGQQSDTDVYATYRLDRGAGRVQLSVNVQQLGFTDAEAADFYRCDRDTYTTCDVKTDVDGSYLLRATKPLPGGGTGVEVDLLRGDGTRVVLATGNTADAKNGGRPHGRGVTVKDGTAIVQSPLWVLDQPAPRADVERARREIRPWTLLS